jgi:hypothetical protein
MSRAQRATSPSALWLSTIGQKGSHGQLGRGHASLHLNINFRRSFLRLDVVRHQSVWDEQFAVTQSLAYFVICDGGYGSAAKRNEKAITNSC